MNEGVGSTTIIVIIMVFIVFASAYMAYNVNYTKAFRMKNKIISVYEEHNGDCDGTCKKELTAYAKEIGYSGASINCSNNPYKPDIVTGHNSLVTLGTTGAQYCAYKVDADNTVSGSSSDVIDANKGAFYYRVVTRIDIFIPIIQNVLQLRVLNVTGDTKVFQS